MKAIAYIFMTFSLCAAISCNKTELQNIEKKETGQNKSGLQSAIADQRADLNFSQLEARDVYFDEQLFDMRLRNVTNDPIVIQPPKKQYGGTLYVYNQSSGSAMMQKVFYPVTSAMPDGNESILWSTVEIRFNPGFAVHQFYSAMDVIIASQGIHPAITLTYTEVVYLSRLLDVAKQPIKTAPRKEH